MLLSKQNLNTWSEEGRNRKMSGCSPMSKESKQATSMAQLSSRLHKCWEMDIDWKYIPEKLKKCCDQAAKAISMPATAVLTGLLFVVSFAMSHSAVKVLDTQWVEPVLVWLAICMPTGCGKSPLCKYLRKLVSDAKAGCNENDANWMLDDQSFEKLGELMQSNNGKLLGLYDELPMFLSQINICRGKSLADSQQVAIFLQLYGGDRWQRRTVSGEANFSMERTGLTVGGFVQPGVAKGLIESTPNIEKGLCQRFLWIVPKPNPTKFEDLGSIDEDFTKNIVNLMSAQWKPGKDVQEWNISKSCAVFRKKYNTVTSQISDISAMDDLLSGMLSKSKGQILRVAASFHVLFHYETPHTIDATISDEALLAAINFVDTCHQHAAYLSGRGDMHDAIESIKEMVIAQPLAVGTEEAMAHSSAALSLTLPGKKLNMSALCFQKKFKHCGKKPGGLKGWKLLEEAGLGKVVEMKAARGTDKLYDFIKKEVPDEGREKEDFAKELAKFGVSLPRYKLAYEMEDITMKSINAAKSSPAKKRLKLSTEEQDE